MHQAPLAALGLGAAFSVIWGVADPVAALAEVRVIEADGYYIMGDGPEENAEVAKERARADARRAAGEQAGLYVAGMPEVKKGKLTQDEIRTTAVAVMEVKEEDVTPEALDGTVIKYHCRMKTVVDAGSITEQLWQDRATFLEDVRRNRELEADLARVNAELAELKERYKAASEAARQEINREMKRNEDAFTAVQWNGKGVERYGRKDYEGAIEYFRRAVEIDPNLASAWNGIGSAYGELGNHEKAVEYCSKAIELAPRNDFYWNYLGNSYLSLGDCEKGMESCRKAVELNPKNVHAWNNIGYAYTSMENYKEALDVLQKAVAIDPKFATVWHNLGYAYSDLKNYPKAIEYFSKAVALDPKSEVSWNLLGICYGDMGDYDKEIECYRKAVEIAPKYADPWNNMGISYRRLGNYPKAVECYRKAVELDPGCEVYRENLEAAEKKL